MIKCLICGYETEKSLVSHIRFKHNISANEYKIKYGGKTVSPEFTSMMSIRNKSDKQRSIISRRNHDPEFIEKCKNGIKNSEKFHKSVSESTSKRNKETWSDPEKSKELRNKISSSAKVRCSTDEYKDQFRERMHRCWNNPEKANKMLNAPRKSIGNSQYYYSECFDTNIYCRSEGEVDFIKAIESIKDFINSIEHESVIIKMSSGRVYIPDFLVTSKDGSKYLVEVKFANPPEEFKEKVLSAINYCNINGMKFCWVRRFNEIPQIYKHKSLDFCVLNKLNV